MRLRPLPEMLKTLFLLAGSALLAASVWIWVQDITIPRQEAEARENGIPRGNLSDLYPRWLGARELLLRGRDPYREDITREIQAGYYGRPLDPNRPFDPKDQQAFAYPLYVVFMLAPMIAMPFVIVQRIFLLLLIALTVASVPLWLHVLRWRISLRWQLVWIILVVGSFPAIQAFKLQQLTLLVAALLAASFASIVRRRLVLAGILLALASIKPQLVVLVGLWLLIWISGNWRERQKLFWSGVASMVILIGSGELLLPGWIHEFRAATSSYYQYTGGGRSVLDAALSPIAGRIVAFVLVTALMVWLWRLRREGEQSPAFQWSLGAVQAMTLVVIPMFAPYNQVLLVPCVMLIAKAIYDVWQANRMSRFFVLLTATAIAWPWVASLTLAVALIWLPLITVQQAWRVPMGSTLMIPVSILALIFVSRKIMCAGSDIAQTHLAHARC
jgi:hypothetical protein